VIVHVLGAVVIVKTTASGFRVRVNETP